MKNDGNQHTVKAKGIFIRINVFYYTERFGNKGQLI